MSKKSIATEKWLEDDETWIVDPDDILADTDRARLAGCAPELLGQLKNAMQHCSCSIAERDSGHMVGCWVPEAEQVVAKAESGSRSDRDRAGLAGEGD